MALTLQDINKRIIQAKAQLLKILVLDVRLKARLQEVEVIDGSLNDELEPLSLSRRQRVDILLDDIKRGPVWRFLHFCKIMHEEGKPDVLAALDVDIDDIDNKLDTAVAATDCPPPKKKQKQDSESKAAAQRCRKRHYYKKTENDDMIQISDDLLPSLLQHCGSYNQTLMKASLFGYQRNKPIDLTRIYIHHDASCQQNRKERLHVGKKELFLLLFGTRCPNCLSMEGPAGTGKSSYLEEYAYDWSQDVTSCEEKGPDARCEGHLWKIVVYIAAGGIRGTAADAIKDNLRCKPHPPDKMMHEVEEGGDGILIMYDAMDELRHKDSIKSISSYIETSQNTPGKPKVLAAARDGLLSVQRRYFDRELHLEGFSLSQGIKYIKQYFKEMYSLSDHPVLHYVEADSQDLKWVLSNPLRVHILSELSACGFLTSEDLKTLTTVKLFRSLDMLLLERDKECRPTQAIQPTAFYTACVKCLLSDKRILSEEDVSTGSPYLSLLQKYEYLDQDFNDRCNYSFPHEMLFEYFSMRGLIDYLKNDVAYKRALLLSLCANSKMRNVLQLTCGYIAQYDPQLLPDVVFIIRACLVLQTENQDCVQNELTQELLQLPSVIQQYFPPNVIIHSFDAEQATKQEYITALIHTLFTEKSDLLREAGWFLNGFTKGLKSGLNSRMSPFHQFVLGSLQQLTSPQLKDVFSQTITQLLPCTRYNMSVFRKNKDMTVVGVGGVRWACLEEASGGSGVEVDITVWSPCDLPSILNTWSNLPRTQQLQHQRTYTVDIDSSANALCTSRPVDLWSEEQWTPSLRELLSPRYYTSGIAIEMGYSPKPPLPLKGLLLACSKVITPGHGLTEGLAIMNGQVTEEELTTLCSWAGELALRLSLEGLTVVLRACLSENEVDDADTAIRRTVEVLVGGMKGCLSLPNYVTEDGEMLYKNYQPVESEVSDSGSDSQTSQT